MKLADEKKNYLRISAKNQTGKTNENTFINLMITSLT